MAVRPITVIGHKALHQPTKKVREVTDEIRTLVEDMFDTMEAANGVGLAANQVGVRLRLFVFDVAGWGWWNLLIGLGLIATGLALFAGQTWARVVAIILAALSAVVQLLLVPAQPWWSIIVIAIDVLVIYALTAHGKELREK